MRILIADDHAIVREGLKQILNDEKDMEVVGEAEDGGQALEKARALRPDITVLDITMPRLTGLDAVRLIKEAVPETQIVVLSMHKKEAYVHQVFSSGALGYVLKASPRSDVLEAIRAAHRGEYFLSSKIRGEVIASYLESRKKAPTVRGYDLLTEREQQVFRLIVEGNSTKQVAEVLCVSPKTVDGHRTSLMSKLGLHDRTEVVKYALRRQLIEL